MSSIFFRSLFAVLDQIGPLALGQDFLTRRVIRPLLTNARCLTRSLFNQRYDVTISQRLLLDSTISWLNGNARWQMLNGCYSMMYDLSLLIWQSSLVGLGASGTSQWTGLLLFRRLIFRNLEYWCTLYDADSLHS